MTTLVRPDPARHASWAAAMTELRAEGEHVNGAGLWMLPVEQQWDLTPAGCERLVATLLAAVDEPAVEPAADGSSVGRVPGRFPWILDDEAVDAPVVGFLALRTELNAWLLAEGGHIGYSVAPSARRRGHASRALALAVRRAADLGIERVLVTCDVANVASARTIESGGGVVEDVRNGKRRYWISTPTVDQQAG